MSLTTDPNDPRLKQEIDKTPVPQQEVYLVLSEEERAKGFVRPLRLSYRHVGIQPTYPLLDLTEEQQKRVGHYGYVKFEAYPEDDSPVTGRYWTQEQLDNKACGTVTSMALPLAETYARDPSFYGATYCAHCQKHLPVEEFVWDGTNERVGS
jgi:hypothetical protein